MKISINSHNIFLNCTPTWGCKSAGTAEVFDDISLAVNVLVKLIPCPIKTWKYVSDKQKKYTKNQLFFFVSTDLWNTSRILEAAEILAWYRKKFKFRLRGPWSRVEGS